ncbi:MAG: outer membrane lipoprotein-sorting protein [Deltaproteobacteria bacterium]|nr:outer membrane lipoprotein-sorting protein [Deltaproteobacteria bacterium]
MAALSLAAKDPISAALESYNSVDTYAVTLNSGNGSEVIRYFYKRPGFIRMEFIRPHKGAVLVYDPLKREVSLRPFGFFKPFVLRLKPDDYLIKSSEGHTVDKSDIGELLRTIDTLRKDGRVDVVGDEKVRGRETAVVEVEGKPQDPSGKSRYILWLEKETMLPLKVESFDNSGKAEEVLMEDLEVNPVLPDGLFTMD